MTIKLENIIRKNEKNLNFKIDKFYMPPIKLIEKKRKQKIKSTNYIYKKFLFMNLEKNGINQNKNLMKIAYYQKSYTQMGIVFLVL